MNKVTVHCNGKTIDVQNDDRGLIHFLINYGSMETFDVFCLSKEEASLFASTIKTVLGEEQSLIPKEKISLSVEDKKDE